jgi:hypothetical protein
MKKKLEAELMNLAHKILRIKNKSDLRALLTETQALQEKLSVLIFLEENLSEIKPTITYTEAENTVAAIYENKDESTIVLEKLETSENIPEISSDVNKQDTLVAEVESVEQEKEEVPLDQENSLEKEEESKKELTEETLHEETIVLNFGFHEEEKEEITPEVTEITTPEKKEPEPEKINTSKNKKIKNQESLDEILGDVRPTPTFVKVTETEDVQATEEKTTLSRSKPLSINDKLKKNIKIGLNDKIAFVKHLFDGSDADFIRVISQLNTFDNYFEARDFIANLVKPDYNNWQGKEEIEERFMHIVENKFL